MLCLRNLEVAFGQTPALRDISLELGKGERMVLAGPSGSGKSTLLLCIAGLLEPDAGEVLVDTVAVTPRSLPPHRRGMGLVLQEPALWPHMSVAGNVGYGLHGRSRRERGQRVAGLLDALGLEGLHKRKPHQLSGGEARRVALARCLAPAPRLLLLDEALVNLDHDSKLRCLDLLQQELEQTGAAMIFVSHAPDELLGLCSRQCDMQQGRLLQQGAGS